jgi:hypothetical protein
MIASGSGLLGLVRPFLSTISQPTDDFADHAWAMLMARLSNDRSPKLHKEVHCTLVVRESTIKCAAKSEDKTLSMPPASLAAKSFQETVAYVR